MSDEQSVARLRELLAIRTVSRPDRADLDLAEFERFIETVQRRYPGVAAALERELVDDYTILYRWRGQSQAAPSVLMAHYDVVPADDAEGWEYPPFSAQLDGPGDELAVWGRGALDDKGDLVAILEGVERALEAGVVPEHDIWLVFGHDEEVHGSGARTAVDVLEQRGVRPAFVLDEGGAIVQGVITSVAAPIALVGVAEKGLATLRLEVSQQGGHAFAPPPLSAIDRVSRAVERLRAAPFPPRLTAAVGGMTRVLGSAASGATGALLRSAQRIPGIASRLLGRLGAETRALTRTTSVVTMIEGGHAQNAVPERASAVLNVRILPGDTVDSVVAHVRRAIADDAVTITVLHGDDPSSTSPAEGPGWDLIRRTAEARFPGVVVSPYLMLGATDARHFTRISGNVYRFSPFEMTADERRGLHGRNERIRVATFLRGVGFYQDLVSAL